MTPAHIGLYSATEGCRPVDLVLNSVTIHSRFEQTNVLCRLIPGHVELVRNYVTITFVPPNGAFRPFHRRLPGTTINLALQVIPHGPYYTARPSQFGIAEGRVHESEGEFMKSTAVVRRNVVNHHITVIGDRSPYRPGHPTPVPEGGATLAFVLTALIAIAWAGTKRYREGGNWKRAVATTSHTD